MFVVSNRSSRYKYNEGLSFFQIRDEKKNEILAEFNFSAGEQLL